VKPIAQTESCQSAHLGYVVSGRMHTVMDNGEEAELLAGEVVYIPPGHDAWVVGDETCVMLDFAGMEHYAEASAGARGTQASAAPPPA
jgi:quercetin dioxygenase-like cupin family protein